MVLGSLPTSLTGSILAAVKNSPILFINESIEERTMKVEFKVLTTTGEA
jgi:hypothetical protein